MKNKFEDSMSKKTDRELVEIINNQDGYQSEAIEAVEQEIKKRGINIEDFFNQKEEPVEEKKEEPVVFNVNREQNDSKTIGVNNKYSQLVLVSKVFGIMAWIIIVLTTIDSLYNFSQNEQFSNQIAIGVFAIGVLLFISLLAISGIIKVVIDIEYNTRSNQTIV